MLGACLGGSPLYKIGWANRHAVSALDVGRQFRSALCTPPFLSAAVAHRGLVHSGLLAPASTAKLCKCRNLADSMALSFECLLNPQNDTIRRTFMLIIKKTRPFFPSVQLSCWPAPFPSASSGSWRRGRNCASRNYWRTGNCFGWGGGLHLLLHWGRVGI